jgi:hypothetical protein
MRERRRHKPFLPGYHRLVCSPPIHSRCLLPPRTEFDSRELQGRLRHALQRAVNPKIRWREFELSLLDVDLGVWQHLQEVTAPDTLAYTDLCCLLAYYGIDYIDNLYRLFQSFRLVSWQPERYPWLFLPKLYSVDLKYLPGYLALLYRKHRDPGLLGTLLELSPEEEEAREAQLGSIAALWDRFPASLLFAASSSPQQFHNLVAAMVYVATTVAEMPVWQSYYATLQRTVYLREWRVTQTARRLMAVLKRSQQHYEKYAE